MGKPNITELSLYDVDSKLNCIDTLYLNNKLRFLQCYIFINLYDINNNDLIIRFY